MSKNIFQACRDGDLDRVQYLVEIENININSKDPNNVIK